MRVGRFCFTRGGELNTDTKAKSDTPAERGEYHVVALWSDARLSQQLAWEGLDMTSRRQSVDYVRLSSMDQTFARQLDGSGVPGRQGFDDKRRIRCSPTSPRRSRACGRDSDTLRVVSLNRLTRSFTGLQQLAPGEGRSKSRLNEELATASDAHRRPMAETNGFGSNGRER